MILNEKIGKIVNNINPVSLDDIDNLKYMNRTDVKYIFSVHKLENILNNLNEDYKILEINGNRVFKYENTYYDTDDFSFFITHQNGRTNRYKIRHRTYKNTDTDFLEVKFKNNKKRTIKQRIPFKRNGGLHSKAEEFINKTTPVNASLLKPTIFNSFERITIVNFKSSERITIDFGLKFSDLDGENIYELPFLGIVEIKKEGDKGSSEFMRILKNNSIYPKRMSKYCIGMCFLNPDVKKNSFKPKILAIKRIKEEYNNATYIA